MRWYEYKMEADDLHAPEDLKAKLLAMADTLPEEEKNRPMMPAQADNTAVVRPQKPPKKAKLIHFPAKQGRAGRLSGRVRAGLRCPEHREAGHRCKEQQHGSVFGQ